MVKQFVAVLLLFAFAPLAFAEDYKVESIGALTETKVTEAEEKVEDVFDQVGCDVEVFDGRTEAEFLLAELW